MNANVRGPRWAWIVLLVAGGSATVCWARSFWFDEGLLASSEHVGAGGIIMHRGTFWTGFAFVRGRPTELINAPTSPDPDLDTAVAEFGLILGRQAYFVGVPGWLVAAAMLGAAATSYRRAGRTGGRRGFTVVPPDASPSTDTNRPDG